MKCPSCNSTKDITGHEYPDVYDGVAYWTCDKCGCRWHRWPKNDPIRKNLEKCIGSPMYLKIREKPRGAK
jgi:hypothetical protein